MKPAILYRAAAALLLLFAAGHTLGFSQVDPGWHVDTLVGSMHSIRFDMMGSQRGYWDLFLGLGYSLTPLYLFSAVLAWQLGGLNGDALARLRLTRWAFALSYVAILAVSAIWLFIVPIIFSGLIALCLTGAALRTPA